MAGLGEQPSLHFGVKVVRVSGLDVDQSRQVERGGALFVRYYVPAGDWARRLRVDTREVVPCGAGGGVAFWGELARFERWGREASTTPAAAGGDIVFELRWRPPPSSGLVAALLGAATGKARRPPSRMLGRAELAWQNVVGASKPAAERWLTLSSPAAGRELSGCKAPKLLVEVDVIRAVAGDDHDVVRQRKAAGGGVGECCSAGEYCGQCRWVGSEEDMFLAATFSQ